MTTSTSTSVRGDAASPAGMSGTGRARTVGPNFGPASRTLMVRVAPACANVATAAAIRKPECMAEVLLPDALTNLRAVVDHRRHVTGPVADELQVIDVVAAAGEDLPVRRLERTRFAVVKPDRELARDDRHLQYEPVLEAITADRVA